MNPVEVVQKQRGKGKSLVFVFSGTNAVQAHLIPDIKNAVLMLCFKKREGGWLVAVWKRVLCFLFSLRRRLSVGKYGPRPGGEGIGSGVMSRDHVCFFKSGHWSLYTFGFQPCFTCWSISALRAASLVSISMRSLARRILLWR